MANCAILLCSRFGRYRIYRLKNGDPKTDPCDTPILILRKVEYSFFISIVNSLYFKYEFIRLIIQFSRFSRCILYITCRVFSMSKNTIPVFVNKLNFALISFAILFTCWIVEWSRLKPNWWFESKFLRFFSCCIIVYIVFSTVLMINDNKLIDL